jgi:23S rRNA (cytosine1962-C5)-methyltransferase
MQRIVLKPGREKSLKLRHPWIFSGAIARDETAQDSGETVDVVAADGSFLARAAYSPQSQIRARVWTFNADEAVDGAFFRRRVMQALASRAALIDPANDACRLVHGEADGLPGLIVDRYGEVLVAQFLSAGADHWRDAILAALADIAHPRAIFERSDADVRALEGLQPRSGLLAGELPDPLVIVEHGLRYRVDVAHGQKTGFFLDQRDNRARIGGLARERDVLNCFCYSGGFTLNALAGGARSVLSIDSSAGALSLAQENVRLNALPADRTEWIDADVFQHLRLLRDQARSFDLIVLDPPKLAPTALHTEKAARAYKDINLLGLKLLRPGGWLATFSCSGGVSADLFRKIVAGAALDAKVDAQIVSHFHAAADHPVALNFPEGEYLKGLLLRRATSA